MPTSLEEANSAHPPPEEQATWAEKCVLNNRLCIDKERFIALSTGEVPLAHKKWKFGNSPSYGANVIANSVQRQRHDGVEMADNQLTKYPPATSIPTENEIVYGEVRYGRRPVLAVDVGDDRDNSEKASSVSNAKKNK